MEARKNEELHDLMDELAEKKYFGEVTVYFQGGSAEAIKMMDRLSKSEMRERMRNRKAGKARAITPFRLNAGGAEL